MPKSINKVTLGGHIASVPEIKHLANGSSLAKFTIAISESYKAKGSDEWTEKTVWVNVSTFNEYHVKACEKMDKGDYVYVEGKYAPTETVDQESGKKRTWPEFRAESIINFGKKNKQGDLTGAVNNMSQHVENFDDIPF